MLTITPFDETETISEIVFRLEHGKLTATEFREGAAVYIEMAIAALKVANPNMFLEGEESVPASPAFGVNVNVRHDVELTEDDIRYGDYTKYVAINRLQRLLDEGVTHLDVTYTVSPRAWNRKESAIVFKASIPAEEFAGQDSITITLVDEARGDRWIKRPNVDTKWGRFFTEVK